VVDGELHPSTSLPGPADPDAPTQGPNLAYIPALDGIRGIAIIVIMGFHGGVFLTSGGFYSLDMFFTLSGFLITTLLISEWQRTTTIRLGAFWARRARRLLPALLVMLLGVALYAAFLIPPDTYTHLRSDGISTLFYFANWHFIGLGSNYFGQTALASPLTHTWSLAVEEQFYLIWPLVVLAVFKLWKSTRVLLCICVVGALASAAEMALLYSSTDVNRVYYGTDTRAQSLLIGAALAVSLSLWSEHRRASSKVRTGGSRRGTRLGGDPAWAARTVRGRTALLAVGLIGAGGSVALWVTISYNNPWAFRGGFFLASLGTAAMLLSVVCSQRSLLSTCLSFSPLRYVGRISYGLYLWHIPLFLYLDNARTGLTGYALFAVRVAATLLVATGSFYLIERPIRRRTFLKGWRAWVATPVATIAVVVAIFAATTAPSLAADGLPPVPQGSALYKGPLVNVLLLGDSTALTLGIGLSEHQSSYDVRLFDGGILGCGVTFGSEFQLQGIDAPMDKHCLTPTASDSWPHVWAHDIETDKPNVVMILVGRWEVANRTYKGHWTNIESPSYAAYVTHQLEYAVGLAGSHGAHVVLLSAPCYDTGEQPDGATWPEDSRARLSIYNGIVRKVATTTANTSLLNFNAMACPGGQYQEYMNGIQVRQSDGVHFTFDGGDVFASRILPIVVALGRRQMMESASGG
jgi:peptidoglycan/LPS O-acetylase OafA/YrhL